MEILGLEFTSSSYAVTINDVAVAQRAEWVARSVLPWAKIELTAKSSQIPSTYTVNENHFRGNVNLQLMVDKVTV